MIQILTFHPNPYDATNYYRAVGPFNRLVKDHPEDFRVVPTDKMDLSWDFINRFDIFFLQRPVNIYQWRILRTCKIYGIPVWIDFDDDYLNIPSDHAESPKYHIQRTEMIKAMCRQADVITVSTQYLFELYKKFNDNVVLIKNALDLNQFDVVTPQSLERQKMILWRGSGSHKKHFELYKDQLIELFHSTPDHVWGFMGALLPEWIYDHLEASRMKIYNVKDPLHYLYFLQHLRPEVVYILLENSEFNQGRSSNGFLESTLAGAKTVMPNMNEWVDLPGFHYDTENPDTLIDAMTMALITDRTNDAANHVLNFLSLKNENKKRIKVILNLYHNKKIPVPPKTLSVEPWAGKKFYEFHLQNGWVMESEPWAEGQNSYVDKLINAFNPNTVFDIGCGSGSTVEVLRQRNIIAYGMDSNKYNYQHFVRRNPQMKEFYIKGDITKLGPGKQFFDLATCIEVFEHMPDDACMRVLELWKGNCNYFVFSSTPFSDTPEFDNQWGHINVKTKQHWVKLFRDAGYMFIQDLDFPTEWAMLFKPVF